MAVLTRGFMSRSKRKKDRVKAHNLTLRAYEASSTLSSLQTTIRDGTRLVY